MTPKILPRYPIYIPSKGRAESGQTAKILDRDDVAFRLVVEPQEAEAYTARYGAERVLVLPFRDRGSVIPARNWIKQHAIAEGHRRHWQLDDNIKTFWRRYRARRLPCHAGVALRVCEDFTDRYENIAVAGLNYGMFVPDREKYPPFVANVHVYSCCLILNETPHEWRGRYNEDTDYCLQVLADGWCTVLLNAFLADKMATLVMKGGNTTSIYTGDGRLRMARSLERLWPGVVTVGRRFDRPQHFIKDGWKRFDTPLRLRSGVDLSAAPAHDEYGMRLAEKREVRSAHIRELVAEHREAAGT